MFQFISTDNTLGNLERQIEAEYTNVFEEKNMLKEDLVSCLPKLGLQCSSLAEHPMGHGFSLNGLASKTGSIVQASCFLFLIHLNMKLHFLQKREYNSEIPD